MKTYREQYDELRFSPQEKQEMVESLLAAVPETHRRVSHKKRVHVLIAAVIAAALCAACASGALRSASEVFANLFGSSQEQASLLEQLGTPLGVSCTQDGLTITADAILADEYTYAILYSIQREDGTSLRADCRGESVSFREYTVQWPQQAQRTSSTLRPYDEDTSDQAVQYLEICQMDQPLQAGRMTAVFRAAMIDEVQADGTIRTVPLGDGPWELSFDFTPKASSIDLPTGQQFQVDGLRDAMGIVLLRHFCDDAAHELGVRAFAGKMVSFEEIRERFVGQHGERLLRATHTDPAVIKELADAVIRIMSVDAFFIGRHLVVRRLSVEVVQEQDVFDR